MQETTLKTYFCEFYLTNRLNVFLNSEVVITKQIINNLLGD